MLHFQRGVLETRELRHYMAGLPLGVNRFARAVRSHCQSTMFYHWSFDMNVGGDDTCIWEPPDPNERCLPSACRCAIGIAGSAAWPRNAGPLAGALSSRSSYLREGAIVCGGRAGACGLPLSGFSLKLSG